MNRKVFIFLPMKIPFIIACVKFWWEIWFASPELFRQTQVYAENYRHIKQLNLNNIFCSFIYIRNLMNYSLSFIFNEILKPHFLRPQAWAILIELTFSFVFLLNLSIRWQINPFIPNASFQRGERRGALGINELIFLW